MATEIKDQAEPAGPAGGEPSTAAGETTVHSWDGPSPEVPGYEIVSEIDRGSMGVVYKATQLSLGRPVALKVLPPHLSSRPAFVERLEEETEALAALSHPNIVTIIDRGRCDGTYYFAMEYVEGRTLREGGIRAPTALQTVRIGEAVADALAYAHSRGIVHRDIKPSNIMVTPVGLVKVMDFGLAGLIGIGHRPPTEFGGRTRMGTTGYMSPEQQLDPLDVDGRADVFSLGVVLYELAARRRVSLPVPSPPSQVEPQADPRLDAVIMRCLEPLPADRYESAQEMLGVLRALRDELEAAPGCPECGQVGAVRERECARCGANLARLFDLCPDCGQPNRSEVRHCLECGANLRARRRAVAGALDRKLRFAKELESRGRADEAAEVLKAVARVRGRAFSPLRRQARDRLEQLRTQRHQADESRLDQGRRLFAAGDLEGAIAAWQQAKPTPEIERLVAQARERLDELDTIHAANGRLNGLLIFWSVVLLVTAVIVSVAA